MRDPVSGSIRVERPTVDVQLGFGPHSWRTKALVDTGSELTLFDRGSGDALGIDFRDVSKPRRSVQIVGREWTVVMEFVTLALPPFEDLEWDAEVGFFLDEWELPYGILGSKGFLEKWAVSFNRYRNYFTVEPIEEWEGRMGIDPYEEFKDLDVWDRPGD